MQKWIDLISGSKWHNFCLFLDQPKGLVCKNCTWSLYSQAGCIGGSRGVCLRHTPQGSRFFCFDIQNFQNITALGVHAPHEVHTPLQEILDLPLWWIHKMGSVLYFYTLPESLSLPKKLTEYKWSITSVFRCLMCHNYWNKSTKAF